MDNEEKKDVKEEQIVENEKNEVIQKNNVENEPEVVKDAKEDAEKKSDEGGSKKTKIILFSVIGSVVVVALIAIIIILANVLSKPSKGEAKKIAQSYISAINDKDKDALLKTIDSDGYIIFKEEGEKKFNEKYKEKSQYIRKYMDKNNLDDSDDLDKQVLKDFNTDLKYSSFNYTVKEVTDVKKSSKSNKLVLIKAKVRVESSYVDTTKVLRLYVTKVKGKYKIVSAELV